MAKEPDRARDLILHHIAVPSAADSLAILGLTTLHWEYSPEETER
jgi:hypothetical protein